MSPAAPAGRPLSSVPLDPIAAHFTPIDYIPFWGIMASSPIHLTHNAPDFIFPNAQYRQLSQLRNMLLNPAHGQVGQFSHKTHHPYNEHYTDDRTFDVMQMILEDLKDEHCFVYEPKLELRPLGKTPPIWPLGWNEFGIKDYVVIQKREGYGRPNTFVVTILPPGSPPTSKTVHAYYVREKMWLPLPEWILKYAEDLHKQDLNGRFLSRRWFKMSNEDAEAQLRHNSLVAQQSWWDRISEKTGKSFPFLKLPSEVRNSIYSYALGHDIYPVAEPLTVNHPPPTASILLGEGYSRKIYREYAGATDSHYAPERLGTHVACPNLSLLRVNKQVNEEALGQVWIHSRKCFFLRKVFKGVVVAQLGPAATYAFDPTSTIQLGHLSKIQLNFTFKDYFRLFGVSLHPVLHVVPSKSFGPQIAGIAGLKQFDLSFRSPADGWGGLPWAPDSGEGPWICCQNTTVSWVCALAWPFLQDPNVQVTLSGSVKKTTKQRWNGNFNENGQQIQQHYMTHMLTMFPLPPPCACRTKCTYWSYSRNPGSCEYGAYEDHFDYEDDFP